MAIITLQRDSDKSLSRHFEFDPEDRESQLGIGGMGVVFKGKYILNKDTGEFKPVAIKVLFDRLDEESMQRAKREANIQIEHKNIVWMYGAVETFDKERQLVRHHVISEYLHGRSLDKILKERKDKKIGLLSQEEALKIIKSLLYALEQLHDESYVHRDIDPSNIMVCSDGNMIDPKGIIGCPDGYYIKLIDFGIVRHIKDVSTAVTPPSALTQHGDFIGKVLYASPEQIEGRDSVDFRSDIYSVGILLYELLTGELPFTGTTFRIIKGHREEMIPEDNIRNLTNSRYLPENLIYIIKKATAKDQSQRYEFVSEFRADIDKVLSGKSPKPAPVKKWFVMIAAALVAACLTVGGVWFMSHQKNLYNTYVEKAASGLSIGSYRNALDLYSKASKTWYGSDSITEKTKMLSFLVEAVREYGEANYQSADSLFKEAIRLNSSDACFYLGEMYYEGLGVPKDYQIAYDYTMKAYEMGNAFAEYRLGLVYQNGTNGIAPDINKAGKFFDNASKVIEKAIGDNNPNLQYLKGNMYLTGNGGVRQNRALALEYFEKAADQGYSQAEYALYECLKNENKSQALEWLEKSAKKNFPQAQHRFGIVLFEEKNYQEAFFWTEKAAANNYAPALRQMGAFYDASDDKEELQRIIGITANDTISHIYTKRAVDYDLEYIKGIRDLADDYRFGRGVEIDLVKADSLDKIVTVKEQANKKLTH